MKSMTSRKNMFYWQTNRPFTAQEQKDIFLDRQQKVKKEEVIAAIEYGMRQSGKNNPKVISLNDPIKYGSVNNVLKAKLNDGKEVVIRMHPYKIKNGYFWVESVVTQKARKQGVPTYATYFIDDTQKKFSFDYMIMEALTGKTMQEYQPLSEKLDRQLVQETGKYAALIHKIKPSGFGFFLNEKAKEGKLIGQYKEFCEHIYAALDEDLKFLVDHDVLTTRQLKAVETIFQKNMSLLHLKKPSLIHNDIADWNELSDGNHITGIVDWDECFSGDTVMEFSAWSLFFDDRRLQFFIEGYKEVSDLPEGYQEKDHLFRLRYLISKMHLRKKRYLVSHSSFLKKLLERGMQVITEEFRYFGF